MLNKESSYQNIAELIERFEDQYDSYSRSDYNEALTMKRMPNLKEISLKLIILSKFIISKINPELVLVYDEDALFKTFLMH